MGRDKALLELGGRPLVAHAVAKLRRVCERVSILSASQELAGYAPLVRDLHPDCGPMGGIEAALAHSEFAWNLVLPVDVPFLPAAFLDWWARGMVSRPGARLGLFRVDGVNQPTLLMIHRELAPYLTAALGRGQYKLMPVLQGAAEDLAARGGEAVETVVRNLSIDEDFRFGEEEGGSTGEAQRTDVRRWFANLNTPEDVAEAEQHVDGLDPE